MYEVEAIVIVDRMDGNGLMIGQVDVPEDSLVSNVDTTLLRCCCDVLFQCHETIVVGAVVELTHILVVRFSVVFFL